MDVTLLYFEGCPSWQVADERLRTVAAERGDLHLTRHLVESPDEAERTAFHGSPSIVVDGVDLFAGPDDHVGLTCRLYPTPSGLEGSPTVAQLREALARAGS